MEALCPEHAHPGAKGSAQGSRVQRTGKDAQPPKVSDKKASDIVGEDAWEQADDETREKLKEQVAADLLRQQLEEEKKLRAIVEKLSSLSERRNGAVGR